MRCGIASILLKRVLRRRATVDVRYAGISEPSHSETLVARLKAVAIACRKAQIEAASTHRNSLSETPGRTCRPAIEDLNIQNAICNRVVQLILCMRRFRAVERSVICALENTAASRTIPLA